jgi:hypothetical protein
VSGPCTLEYLLIQGALLGAKAVLDSARDVGEGLGEARATAHRDATDRLADLRRMREEARGALRHLAARASELEAALDRLRSLAATLTTGGAENHPVIAIDTPARPAMLVAHPLAGQELAAYTARLEEALAAGHARLSAVAARMAADDDAAPERIANLVQPRSLGELLDAYLARHRVAQTDATLSERRARLERLLAPLATHEAIHSLPPDIGVLLAELSAPGEEQRAQAVELELHRLVAAERARREARGRDAARARVLLAEMDERLADDPESNAMRQTLEFVASGLVDLTPEIEARALSLAAALKAAEAEILRKAAAAVLEGTLADLGFVVEPISHTLFVEGGVAHFSRPEWGEYAVRLRASPTDGTLNFNVVREAPTAQTDALSARLRDMRAEETWCEHIPKLAETLEARGIRLKVKRRLGAGEAPVQVVPAGALAGLPEPDATRAASPPPAAREAP